MNIWHSMAVLSALIGLSVPALAAEAQIVPLKNYIEQPGVVKDPAAMGYVMERCAAFYAVFSKGLEGEMAPDRLRLKEETTTAAAKFWTAAVQLMMRGTTIQQKNAEARTADRIVDLGNLYAIRIAEAKLRNNNMFSDSLIAGDVNACKAILAKM